MPVLSSSLSLPHRSQRLYRRARCHPQSKRHLRFNIYEEALELPAGYRTTRQGYESWFYLEYDLEEIYPLMGQTNFIAELSERLKTQGVTLVVLPISSRALI